MNDFGIKYAQSTVALLNYIISLVVINTQVDILSVFLFIFPAVSIFALVFLIRKITLQKEYILTLFLEVPESAYLIMNKQCEKFISVVTLQTEDDRTTSGASVDADDVFENVEHEKGNS